MDYFEVFQLAMTEFQGVDLVLTGRDCEICVILKPEIAQQADLAGVPSKYTHPDPRYKIEQVFPLRVVERAAQILGVSVNELLSQDDFFFSFCKNSVKFEKNPQYLLTPLFAVDYIIDVVIEVQTMRYVNAFRLAVQEFQGVEFILKGRGHEPRICLKSKVSHQANLAGVPHAMVCPGPRHGVRRVFPLRVVERAAEILGVPLEDLLS